VTRMVHRMRPVQGAGEPRVLGVTALHGSGKFGGRGESWSLAYPRLGASVSLGIDPDVLKEENRVRLERNAEGGI
jgi:hypothetical protein